MLTLKRSIGWASPLVPSVALVMVAGCASLQPAAGTPITDIGAIAGKWAGTVTPGNEFFYLTITPNGELTATWGPNYAWGTVTLGTGKATFRMEPGPYEGTVTLYASRGSRLLILDDNWLAFYAQVTPR
jgi:hypothetical protein